MHPDPGVIQTPIALGVGDEVRVSIPDGRRCRECPHFVGEQGHIGRIADGPTLPYAPSHRLFVVFSEPCHIVTTFSRNLPIVGRHYAADELEPLGGPH